MRGGGSRDASLCSLASLLPALDSAPEVQLCADHLGITTVGNAAALKCRPQAQGGPGHPFRLSAGAKPFSQSGS